MELSSPAWQSLEYAVEKLAQGGRTGRGCSHHTEAAEPEAETSEQVAGAGGSVPSVVAWPPVTIELLSG